jgi:hypothetical protein|tara:strand:+ start:111 stop:224 length:114 start_codon:yes stop_codon:yes gene_type:complete
LVGAFIEQFQQVKLASFANNLVIFAKKYPVKNQVSQF